MVLSEGRKAGSGGWLPGWSAAGWPAAAPGCPQQLQAGVEVLRPQEAQRGGQVSCSAAASPSAEGAGRLRLPPFFPSSHRRLPCAPHIYQRAHSLEVGTRHNQSKVGVGCAWTSGWNLKMVTRLRGTGSSRGQNEGGGGWGRVATIFMLGVGAKGMGAHPGGSAGHWCAAQGLDLLLHDVHVLCVLVVEAVHARRRPAPAGPRPGSPAEATSHLPLFPPTLCPAHPHNLFVLAETPA